jgi:predicted O-methyltransferase YrrM
MSIVDERLSKYINDIQPLCSGELGELQKAAYEEGLPIIPNDVVRLMGVILGLTKPKKILEIGMAVGFSSIYMSDFLPEDGSITTIDRYPYMIDRAKENFEKFGKGDKINLIVGDAVEVLKELDGEFDLVFMDAAKGQYINILPDVIRLTRKGGLIVADDVLQDGRVAMERLDVPRRQRTMHTRLNEFLSEISNNKELRSSILTVGDGVALMQKL